MNKLKVLAKTCYLGKTGYAAHARGVFRSLSRFVDLRVINYTWDENYKEYLNETDREILWKLVLSTPNGPDLFDFHTQSHFYDYEWKVSGTDFDPEIEIVLIDNGHYFFRSRKEHPGVKFRIAYTVWESTELDLEFIKILKEDFDQIWVVTQWHKECLVNQGIKQSKIYVVREAVEPDMYPLNFHQKEFHPLPYYRDDFFNFIFFGRWDYRKCLPEITKAFVEEFKPDEKVRLILSAENPFAGDGKTTEDRLSESGIVDERIVSIGFVNRLKYIRYLQAGHCFVSCARSEGWNIPLSEAIAAGTPAIYSNWGAQLEFAKDKGIPVNVPNEEPASLGHERGIAPLFPGNYASPDFEDLKRAMREVKENYGFHKEKALLDSQIIRENFTWDKAAESGYLALLLLESSREIGEEIEEETVIDSVNVHFVDGPYVEVKGRGKERFKIEFIDTKNDRVVYESTVAPGEWAKCNRKWYTDWYIKMTKDGELVWDHTFDVSGKRVFVSIESSSLGDNLAWFPHTEIFRKEKGAHVIVSTFMNEIFESKYPDLEFVGKGANVPNLYACFRIGWFYKNDEDDFDPSMHPFHFRTIPMQKAATDILGLPFSHEKPMLKKVENEHPFEGKKYVTIAIHGTAQSKYWNNPAGWQDIVDFLRDNGYRIVLISSEENGYMGNQHPKDIFHKPGKPPIYERINEIQHSDLFIGVGSGLSWLAWTTGVPTIMISGFSEPYSEFEDENMVRIINKDVCTGCFNRHKLDAGDWNWCPNHKGTPRQFECTKMIGSYPVIKAIKKLLNL